SEYLKSRYKGDIRIIVNFDTRFLSSRYADEVIKVLSLNKIKSFIPERDTPIPAISFFVSKQMFNGAVNFTGGIKGPIFNGIKILNEKGAPELHSETEKIERIIRNSPELFSFKPQYTQTSYVNYINPRNSYLKYIEKIVEFELIRESGLKIIVDNLYGSSRDYLDFILNVNGIDTISIHNFPYSSFGNLIPDCSKESLKELSSIVLKNKADMGLATDIGGNRFGIINSKGVYIEQEKILPPLIEYLIKERKMKGGVIKSVSATENIRNVAEHYLRKVHECPVGFKYLADEMDRRKVFIALEGANGGTLHAGGKIRDGILFNLLISEMVAFYGMGLDDIIESFYSRFPKLFKSETEVRVQNIDLKKIDRVLSGKGLKTKGFNPLKFDHMDGIKI
ncbi:MAG: hypothetical protein KAS97_03135, partial [Candidatus Aminicenantes bacterium]|nr:hypothetical protein [Candidatus Aminicenantes bacterium]